MTPLPFNEKCLILLCLKTRGQSISHGWTRMHTDKNQGLSYRCSSVADLSLPRCQERLILIPRPQESRVSTQQAEAFATSQRARNDLGQLVQRKHDGVGLHTTRLRGLFHQHAAIRGTHAVSPQGRNLQPPADLS